MSDPQLFEYDCGILSGSDCTDNTFDVFVIPSVPRHRISDALTYVPEMFILLRETQFGSPSFRQGLARLCRHERLDMRVAYRLAALLILVDQRKKMQYLTQGTVMQSSVVYGPHYNASFTHGVPLGRVTRSELRQWAKNIPKYGRGMILGAVDALYNVMVMEASVSVNHGDLIMLFNGCGTYYGHVFGYWNLEFGRPAMIGIRSSITRMVVCGQSTEPSCLKGRLGMLLYAARTLLANYDGHDRVMITNPIGGMRQLLKRSTPEVQKVLLSLLPYATIAETIASWMTNVRHVYIPTYRQPLTMDNAWSNIHDLDLDGQTESQLNFLDLVVPREI